MQKDDPKALDGQVAKSEAMHGFPSRIPAWVPPCFVELAKRHCACTSDSDFFATIIRLTVDPRMHRVWSQLLRKRRKDGRFLYPARSDNNCCGTAEERQQQTITKCILWRATLMAACQPRAVLERDMAAIARDYLDIASRLRKISRKVYFHNWGEATEENISDALLGFTRDKVNDQDRARRLDAAATALEELAAEAGANSIVIERDRGALDVLPVAIANVKTCRHLFGQPLYGVAAALTSVMLNRSVTSRQVREWWETHQCRQSG